MWQKILSDLKGLQETAQNESQNIPDIEIEELMLEGFIECGGSLGN